MCATMSFVATQPLRYNGGSGRTVSEPEMDCMRLFYFAPCYRSRIEDDSDQDSSGTAEPRQDPCNIDQVTSMLQ